jgi:hypothetical protein
MPLAPIFPAPRKRTTRDKDEQLTRNEKPRALLWPDIARTTFTSTFAERMMQRLRTA